jgi:D-xylose transport system permease protein
MESTKKTSSFSFATWIRQNIQSSIILLAMVAIWIFFYVWTGGAFLSPQNVSNLFRQMTVTSFLAIGMVLVIVTTNIDLSVGKLAGFISVIVAYLQAYIWYSLIPDNPLLAAILSVVIGLAIGILLGVIQGYIISYLGVPAFIVTLGAMWMYNGAILIVTGGKTIPANQPFFSFIAQGYLPVWAGWVIAVISVAALFFTMVQSRRQKRRYGFQLQNIYLDLGTTTFFSLMVIVYVYVVNLFNGVQIPVLIMAVTALIMAYLANNTPFGRYAYAIGGNREAARLSGINIRFNVFTIFVIMGLLCAVAGIVLASYVGYGTIAAGNGYELDAIASCFLGGVSTLGGIGSISMALSGALIMASLTNGLQIMNVQPAWQYLLKGAVLILAVYADVYLKRKQ